MNRQKRAFDLLGAVAGLILLSPVFAVIALLIKMEDAGPIVFRQLRVGLNGSTFKILKFRTMVTGAERVGGHLTIGRDPRITRVGFFLRRTKLDELPQLLNVVRGEMSLVGPRPEVPKYVDLYTLRQRKVLAVQPGITDPGSLMYLDEAGLLAQAADSERAYIEEVMPQKLEANLAYAQTANFARDLAVIFRTIRFLAKRRLNQQR